MGPSRTTLEEHLVAQQPRLGSPEARGMAAIIGRIGAVAAVIAQELAHAALRDQLGYAGGVNLTGDQVKKLDVWGHEIMAAALRKTGVCAALVAEEAPDPVEMPQGQGPSAGVGAGDPVDGSAELSADGGSQRAGDGGVGTVRAGRRGGGGDRAGPAALGPGTDQIAAGYVMYGPATTLVYTAGQGTHGFTMDRASGQFFLTHPDIRVPNGDDPGTRTNLARIMNHGTAADWAPSSGGTPSSGRRRARSSPSARR